MRGSWRLGIGRLIPLAGADLIRRTMRTRVFPSATPGSLDLSSQTMFMNYSHPYFLLFCFVSDHEHSRIHLTVMPSFSFYFVFCCPCSLHLSRTNSGTTGKPKGVLYTYRGMYLAALGNAIEAQLRLDSVHLFIVPLFHANSWIFPYAVTAIAGKCQKMLSFVFC